MKINLTVLYCIMTINTLVAQGSTQIFKKDGFKVKCDCELNINSLYIKMAKQNGINNILAAYICGENQDSPETGVANNINITDESASYNKMSTSNYGYFEKKTLEVYARNLQNSGFDYNYTIYKGVPALEYSFNQQGLPTKAIFFLKNKKTYLIQVGTRTNLLLKYNQLKNSFEIF
jgi:hypothetical protein